MGIATQREKKVIFSVRKLTNKYQAGSEARIVTAVKVCHDLAMALH